MTSLDARDIHILHTNHQTMAEENNKEGDNQLYSNLTIVNVVDGTTIQGHDAVKAYFEREEALAREYGTGITFECFHVDMNAETLENFMERFAEIKVEGNFVGGMDTVASVIEKVKGLLVEKGLVKGIEGYNMTLFFNSRHMEEHKLFYAEHFMMLPVWVQVCIHSEKQKEFLERFDELVNKSGN